MTLTTGMSMAGKMSTGMVTIEATPRTAMSSASTTNVYGRRRARRTIHMAQWVPRFMSLLGGRHRRPHRTFMSFPQGSDSRGGGRGLWLEGLDRRGQNAAPFERTGHDDTVAGGQALILVLGHLREIDRDGHAV